MVKKFKKYFGSWRKLRLNLTLTFPEREYLSSRVNMLTNSLKISDPGKKEFFELEFFQIDKTI